MAGSLPPLFTCRVCRQEISPNGKDVFHKVCGWSDSKPGSKKQMITLAEQMHIYAHGACIRILNAGGVVAQSQDSLF